MISEALEASARASRAGARPAPYRATPVALAVTGALAPAYVVRWHLGPLPTTLLEAAVLVTIAIFAVESARARVAPAWRSPLAVPAALFLVAGGIAVLAAPSRVAALGVYRAYLLEPVALALVLATVVRTSRQAWLVVGGFWLGGCVLALANAEIVLQAAREHRLDVRAPAPAAL
ncbi:MAG TPA: hypothetical protein VLW53_05015, partial [Candidatus Eisenbacteria bacterium]|nr:hypothetical protein [Candidatus Eisenbacteria bacterium]